MAGADEIPPSNRKQSPDVDPSEGDEPTDAGEGLTGTGSADD